MKMRKLTLVLMICIISTVLLGNSQASYEGILLKNYQNTSQLKEILKLHSSEYMNEIIILPEEVFNEKEAAFIISNVQRLPDSLLVKIQQNNIHIKLFNGKLTDNPSADHLKGISPRGYTSNKKWDNVPGIGGGSTVLVKIGHSEKGMGHGSINLELHELAHSIDQIVFEKIRLDPLFLKIWSKEKNSLFANQTYLTSLPEEYFAESFAMYYINEENKAILKKRAPETYEYIKNLK